MLSIPTIIMAIVAVIIIIIVIVRRFFGGHRRRQVYKRAKAARVMATDDIDAVMAAHVENPDDPLVLIYNRPDVAQHYRDDILTRLQDGIINAEETDEIPRFVDAGRLLGVDFAPVATATTARVATADVRRLGVPEIVARAQKIAEDPQNVHDPTVIKQMNDTLKEMDGVALSRQATRELILSRISELTKSGEISASRGDDAIRVLTRMMVDGGTCASYGDRHEADILCEAWAAAPTETHTANIISGLADAVSDGHVVCVNGRIARVLGANTTQVTSGDLKAAAYAYAGSVYAGLGDEPTKEDIAIGIGKVDTYVNDMTAMPEEQRRLVREECRAVFADLED